MDLTQFTVASFVVIGLVNGVQLAADKDWTGFIKFMVAVAAATIFGFFHWFALPSAEIGFAVGVASSGIYKVAQKIGGE